MDNPQELQSVDGSGIKKSARTTETEVSSEAERDAQALARLGKKPILKVCLGIWTHFQATSLTDCSGVLPSCQCWALRAQFLSHGKQS